MAAAALLVPAPPALGPGRPFLPFASAVGGANKPLSMPAMGVAASSLGVSIGADSMT